MLGARSGVAAKRHSGWPDGARTCALPSPVILKCRSLVPFGACSLGATSATPPPTTTSMVPPLALLPPQRLCDRVLGRERIGQRGRRAVANAGAAIEPAQRLFAGRPAKPREREQRRQRQHEEKTDADRACKEWQHQPQSSPG